MKKPKRKEVCVTIKYFCFVPSNFDDERTKDEVAKRVTKYIESDWVIDKDFTGCTVEVEQLSN